MHVIKRNTPTGSPTEKKKKKQLYLLLGFGEEKNDVEEEEEEEGTLVFCHNLVVSFTTIVRNADVKVAIIYGYIF